MNNKKGFTLIELLAVIAILAVLATITIPIILHVVDNSKEKSILASAKMYIKSLGTKLSELQIINYSIKDGVYNIIDKGNVCIKEDNNNCIEKIEMNLSELYPTSGQVKIEDGIITCVYNLIISDYRISCDSDNNLVISNDTGTENLDPVPVDKKCTYADLDSSGTLSKGDKVSCQLPEKTDSFYVIETPNANTVKMITEWNLNVKQEGNDDSHLYPNVPVGYQDEHVVGWDTGTRYGTVQYTTASTLGNINGYQYVYGTSSIPFTYVQDYTDLISETLGVTAVGRLISYEEIINLECYDDDTCSNTYEWIMNTSFWTGTSQSTTDMWDMLTGFFSSMNIDNTDCLGVRPVILVPPSVIENA